MSVARGCIWLMASTLVYLYVLGWLVWGGSGVADGDSIGVDSSYSPWLESDRRRRADPRPPSPWLSTMFPLDRYWLLASGALVIVWSVGASLGTIGVLLVLADAPVRFDADEHQTPWKAFVQKMKRE